jgi:hypothetical protein
MPWGHIRFLLKALLKKLQKGSFDWELKGLVPFLLIESVWRVTDPPLLLIIPPNTSNQNFQIAIWFNVVESSEI